MFTPHNAHLQVVILDNDRSLSRITTWAFLKECKMASTAVLQVQVHEAGGLQRQQPSTAFAELLSAMEALPGAFLAGKFRIFITELRLLHLWVHSSPVMLGWLRQQEPEPVVVSAAFKLSNNIFFVFWCTCSNNRCAC